LDKAGYKNTDVGIRGKSVKFVNFQNAPACMQRIAEDIKDLVQNADSMDREEYLKRAVQLQYRFIRIHPSSDSNGRTSRALLNMMTIPKGMLIVVPKEKKTAFVQAQQETNEKLDERGYFEALKDNLDELDKIEADNMDLPTYDFIRENCVIEIESLEKDFAPQENELGNQAKQVDTDEPEQ